MELGLSEFLDDLARSLAKPMPRRRALRLVGGAIATAMLPASLVPRARGGVSSTTLTTCETTCHSFSGQRTKVCNCHVRSAPGTTVCNHCCCLESEDCQCPTGACVCASCPGAQQCGSLQSPKCCEKGEYCAGTKCCKDGGEPCAGDCCPPPKRCVPQVGSSKKACRCPEDTTPCGTDQCCKSGTETCLPDGSCCPGGGIATRTIIHKTPGKKPARTQAMFCCPEGTVASGNECCQPGESGCCGELSCLPGTWCVDGHCVRP